MRALLLVTLVVAGALAVTVPASARQSCTAGTHGSYRTFCGPAHAKLKDGGKTFSFKGGSCSKSGSTWSINIGEITLAGNPKYDYFGITVFGAKAGTDKNAAIAWQMPGGKRGSLLKTTVKFASGLKSGTFTGTDILGGGKGSGSFSCG